MTWQGKRRKQLPSNWGAIRKRVLERDGYRCTHITPSANTAPVNGVVFGIIPMRCTERATEVHHINGPTDHRLESLRAICSYHHNLETQAEAAEARDKARALNPPVNPRLRPKSKHPGLA